VPIVQERSGGKPIYAGPDSDVIYFLSGLPDAVFYGAGNPLDPMEDAENVFRCLEEKNVRAVVLNRAPLFADHLRPEVAARFEKLFPRSRPIGQFVVRWRD
jgi:hypothetical protein